MTKEQTIKHLKLMQSGARNAIRFTKNDKEISEEERKEDIEIYQDQLEALEMAIKALEQQPSDDCVSRKDVLEMFGYETAIYELPPVTPTRKVANWIGEEEGYYSECSCCGGSFLWEDYKYLGDWKYCPKCGAEMRE